MIINHATTHTSIHDVRSKRQEVTWMHLHSKKLIGFLFSLPQQKRQVLWHVWLEPTTHTTLRDIRSKRQETNNIHLHTRYSQAVGAFRRTLSTCLSLSKGTFFKRYRHILYTINTWTHWHTFFSCMYAWTSLCMQELFYSCMNLGMYMYVSSNTYV